MLRPRPSFLTDAAQVHRVWDDLFTFQNVKLPYQHYRQIAVSRLEPEEIACPLLAPSCLATKLPYNFGTISPRSCCLPRVLSSGMPKRGCKICSAPDEAREIVDKLLTAKTFLRDIARQTGLSKSSIHRHAQKCFVRVSAARLKARKFHERRDRVLIALGGGAYSVSHDPLHAASNGAVISQQNLRESDACISVTHEPVTEAALAVVARREAAQRNAQQTEAIEIPDVGNSLPK